MRCIPEVVVEDLELREVAVKGWDVLTSYTAECSYFEDITYKHIQWELSRSALIKAIIFKNTHGRQRGLLSCSLGWGGLVLSLQ